MPPGQSAINKHELPYIYGSSRLGINALETDLVGNTPPQVMNFVKTKHKIGRKYYELTNHLGNVLATFTDKKTTHDDNADGTVDYLTADLKTVQDYSPFGVLLDGRNWESKKYRYGFNGMEKDEEVKGKGNSYNFGARIYDNRLGRWLSNDELAAKYPDLSPYNFVANSPLVFIDSDGKRIVGANEKSANLIYSDLVTSVYGDDDVMRGVFVLEKNEIVLSDKYAGMSRAQFNLFLKRHFKNKPGGSALRKYTNGLYKAVRTKKKITVEYVENGNISHTEYADGNGNMKVTIVTQNDIKFKVVDNETGKSSEITDRQNTAAHEIFGEAYTRIALGLTSDQAESDLLPYHAATDYINVQSIEVSNFMARLKNTGWHRTGENHNIHRNKHIIDDNKGPDEFQSLWSIDRNDRQSVQPERINDKQVEDGQ